MQVLLPSSQNINHEELEYLAAITTHPLIYVDRWTLYLSLKRKIICERFMK